MHTTLDPLLCTEQESIRKASDLLYMIGRNQGFEL